MYICIGITCIKVYEVSKLGDLGYAPPTTHTHTHTKEIWDSRPSEIASGALFGVKQQQLQ